MWTLIVQKNYELIQFQVPCSTIRGDIMRMRMEKNTFEQHFVSIPVSDGLHNNNQHKMPLL